MLILQILWIAALMLILHTTDHIPVEKVEEGDKKKKRSTFAKARGVSWSDLLQVVLVALGVLIFKGPKDASAATDTLTGDAGPISTYTWKAENEGMALAQQTILWEASDFRQVLESWSKDTSTLEAWQKDSLDKWWTALLTKRTWLGDLRQPPRPSHFRPGPLAPRSPQSE